MVVDVAEQIEPGAQRLPQFGGEFGHALRGAFVFCAYFRETGQRVAENIHQRVVEIHCTFAYAQQKCRVFERFDGRQAYPSGPFVRYLHNLGAQPVGDGGQHGVFLRETVAEDGVDMSAQLLLKNRDG